MNGAPPLAVDESAPPAPRANAAPRVLHFIPFVGWGGANTAGMTLIAEQSRRRQTYLLALNEDHTAVVARSHGVIVDKAHQGADWPRFKPLNWFKTLRGLSRMVRRYDIQIIHAHSAAAMKFCRVIKRLAGVKVVSHQRDNFERNRFHKGIDAADRIVCVSEWILKGMPPELADRSVALLDAVELPAWTPQPIAPGQCLRIGMAGRCDPIKGMHLFLDAMLSLMTRHDVAAELWGLDDSDYGQQLRERVAGAPDDLRRRVKLEPFRTDMDEFYRAIDVAVVPSTYPDPFPRTVTEAMTRGKPPVVARHGGMVEIVEDGRNGVTFNPGDAQDLARVLEAIIVEPARLAAMGRAARSTVEAKLDPVTYADDVDRIYSELTH